MTEHDFDEFAALLSAVAETLQSNRAMSPLAIAVYWGALKDMDFPVFREALSRHVKNPDTGQFMPKPADIIRMAEGSTKDRALQAWTKVDKAVRCVGSGTSVVFDDALIHRVIAEMGGWATLGGKKVDEWPFVARDFEARYRAYSARGEVPEYPPVLIGAFESENRRAGMLCEPPMMIGVAADAARVMQGGNHVPMIGIQQMGVIAANQAMIQIASQGKKSA